MKDLRRPASFLGLSITWHSNGSISLNQSAYVDLMLSRFSMKDAIIAKIPLDPSLPLLKATPHDRRANLTLYQELIGSLNHIAVYS